MIIDNLSDFETAITERGYSVEVISFEGEFMSFVIKRNETIDGYVTAAIYDTYACYEYAGAYEIALEDLADMATWPICEYRRNAKREIRRLED